MVGRIAEFVPARGVSAGRLLARTVVAFCLVGSALSQTAEPADLASHAAVRVAYLVLNGPTIVVELGDSELLEGVAPGAVTEYRSLRPGSLAFAAFESLPDDAADEGRPANEEESLVDPDDLSVQAGRYYTLLVTRGEDGEPFRTTALEDTDIALPPAGRTRVRVVHAVAEAPNLNVLATSSDAEADVPPADAERPAGDDEAQIILLASDLAFGSMADPADASPGAYRLVVRTVDEVEPLHEDRDLVLYDGAIYTLWLFGSPGDGALALAVSVDAFLRDMPSQAHRRPEGSP